jgi:dCTP diphosphatase
MPFLALRDSQLSSWFSEARRLARMKRRSSGHPDLMAHMDDLRRLQTLLDEFAAQRDWRKFHSPKNLVMALTGEVGELTELFQWLTPEEASTLTNDPHSRKRVEEEIADVFIYLLRLADVLDVDLIAAAHNKIGLNASRYPEDVARGNAIKYTELEGD